MGSVSFATEKQLLVLKLKPCGTITDSTLTGKSLSSRQGLKAGERP